MPRKRYKKYHEFLSETLTGEIKAEPKTKASAQARKLGLGYIGFGRYTDKKGQMYVVQNDQLVPYKKDEDIQNTYAGVQKAKDPEQVAAIHRDVNFMAKTRNARKKEDQVILKQKAKDAIKIGKQLGEYYSRGLYDENETAAIQNYINGGSEAINRFLYKGYDEGTDANMAAEMENMITSLDSAFQESGLPFDTKVYTGLSERYSPEKMSPGLDFVFRGYVSTTLDYNVCMEGSQTLMEIQLRKGQKAIYTGDDMETLLPRGSKIKILSGPHFIDNDILAEAKKEAQPQLAVFDCELVEEI